MDLNVAEEMYDGPVRAFKETGLIVAYGSPGGKFWNPYSAHSLQSHDPPRPSSQLEIEDASLPKLLKFLKDDHLWRC